MERAAEIARVPLSDFVRTAAEDGAEQVLREHDATIIVPAMFFEDIVHAQDGSFASSHRPCASIGLGQFFAIRGQPLGVTRVGPAIGPLTVFVNGRRYTRTVAGISLASHEGIQIDVGKPIIPAMAVVWSNSQL
jgi:hypothetical protein